MRHANSGLQNELSKGVTFYKERLGLAFERMPDNSLSFRLTLIDPEVRTREWGECWERET